jgi:hypothetical protein
MSIITISKFISLGREDDPLAIRLMFDTSLNLQKEIEARQKHKGKSASANE